MNVRRTGVCCVVLLLFAVPVLAHVPSFPEDNTSPDRAVDVPDAVKSWSFYDRVGGGEVKYYRVTLDAGERLYVGTFTPVREGLTPSFVVMSSALSDADSVPVGVTVPDGMGAVVVPGERPASASYEPFAPSANYHTASLDRPVENETTFLVAVYDPANRSGPVGVTVGYEESFSVEEYVTVPFDLVRTHSWEGQSPLLAVGPYVLTVVVGAVAFWRRRPADRSVGRLLLAWAGLLVLASGVNTAVQMPVALVETGPTLAALVTAAYVVVPLLCGGWAVRRALQPDLAFTIGMRVGLVLAGLLAVATWAGFLLGPAVLAVLAVLQINKASALELDPEGEADT
jgi:hypothetical protein